MSKCVRVCSQADFFPFFSLSLCAVHSASITLSHPTANCLSRLLLLFLSCCSCFAVFVTVYLPLPCQNNRTFRFSSHVCSIWQLFIGLSFSEAVWHDTGAAMGVERWEVVFILHFCSLVPSFLHFVNHGDVCTKNTLVHQNPEYVMQSWKLINLSSHLWLFEVTLLFT